MGRTRNTAQRQEIAQRLEELSSFVSSQQLHDDLAKSGSRIGLATVYRTLQVLLDEGEVEAGARQIAAEGDCVDVEHTLELMGTCSPCAGGEKRR